MERPSTVMTRARKVNTTATSTTAMTMVSVQSSTERAKGLPPRGFSLWGRAVSSTASPSFPNLEIYGYTGPRLWKGNRWNTAFPKMFRSSIMPTSW